MSKIMKKIYDMFDRSQYYSLEDAIKHLKEFSLLRKGKQSINLEIHLEDKKNTLPNNYVFTIPYGLVISARILVVTNTLNGEILKKNNPYDDPNNKCFVKVGTIDDVKLVVFESNPNKYDYILTDKEHLINISKYAKELVALKLMPSVKHGTVEEDLKKGITKIISGCNISVKKHNGYLRLKIAEIDTEDYKVKENIEAILITLSTIVKNIHMIKSIILSTTRGPGIHLNPKSLSLKTNV